MSLAVQKDLSESLKSGILTTIKFEWNDYFGSILPDA